MNYVAGLAYTMSEIREYVFKLETDEEGHLVDIIGPKLTSSTDSKWVIVDEHYEQIWLTLVAINKSYKLRGNSICLVIMLAMLYDDISFDNMWMFLVCDISGLILDHQTQHCNLQ